MLPFFAVLVNQAGFKIKQRAPSVYFVLQGAFSKILARLIAQPVESRHIPLSKECLYVWSAKRVALKMHPARLLVMHVWLGGSKIFLGLRLVSIVKREVFLLRVPPFALVAMLGNISLQEEAQVALIAHSVDSVVLSVHQFVRIVIRGVIPIKTLPCFLVLCVKMVGSTQKKE